MALARRGLLGSLISPPRTYKGGANREGKIGPFVALSAVCLGILSYTFRGSTNLISRACLLHTTSLATLLMSNADTAPLDGNLKAPRVPMKWDHSAPAIAEITTSAIEKSRAIRDKIAALPRSSCTFKNVFLALSKEESELENKTGPLTFYQYVSTQDELRDAANTAEQRLNEYSIEASMRIDVFEALKAAKANIDLEGLSLTPEENRLVEKMLLDGKRSGLDLPEGIRNQVATVSNVLDLCVCSYFSVTLFTIILAQKRLVEYLHRVLGMCRYISPRG